MSPVEGGRARTRVGSGQPGAPSSPAPAWPVPGYRPGSAAAATPPDPLPVRPASAGAFVGSAPAWRAAPPAAAAAAPTAAWGAPFQPQPPQLPQPQPSAYLPEPPAPRSWTPSKLSTGTATPRMSPAEALEREMSELACSDACVGSVASTAVVQARPRSGLSGGGAGRKVGFESTSSEAAAQPFVAPHNNLMPAAAAAVGVGSRPGSRQGAGGGWDDGSGRASPGTLSRLRDKLGGHLSPASPGSPSSSTAVTAFSEPLGDGATPVAVAQRQHAKPVRLLPSGHAGRGAVSAAEWQAAAEATGAAGDGAGALLLPGPSNGLVRCYLVVHKGLLGLSPWYELRLEASDALLAVARRRSKGTASVYHIMAGGGAAATADSAQDDDVQQSLAELKSNLLGTEYMLRTRGGDPVAHGGLNRQLLAVNYKPTINHIQAGPRTMSATVPVPGSSAWDSGAAAAPGRQLEDLAACLEAARARELPPAYEQDLVMLHTTAPHYDPVKQVHYLDFKGRVTKVSVKNFQLVGWDHNSNSLGTELVMLFGKQSGEYALDFSYPLNGLQALGLALSSIDSKLCCMA